jgi:hypothetical protein
MNGMYSLRHNAESGEMYKSIAKGRLGASTIVQDIGRHNAAETAEAQAGIQTRIGAVLRAPRQLTDDERSRLDRCRPDIFIHVEYEVIHIVEIKCCRDTDPEPQRERATAQHRELADMLQNLFTGIPVHIHPIVIGVTGTIYKDFYDTMDLLGVSKSEAKRCAAKIHKIAVNYVDKIMTTKWQQEKSGVG